MNTMVEWAAVYPWRTVLVVVGLVVGVWLGLVATVPLEMGSAILALVVGVAPLVAVGFSVTERYAVAWGRDRGARLAAERVDQLRRYLLRTRLARTAGVAGAIAANFMLMSHHNADPDGFPWFIEVWNPLSGSWWFVVLGYVLSSAWAEATKPHEVLDGRPGAALLSRRRVIDYLDPGIGRILGGFAVLASLATALWVFLPDGTPRFGAGDADGQRLDEAWGAALALGVGVLALGLAAWVCRRRQRAHDDAALIYEELTRTATANALAGAAIAMLGTFAGVLVQDLWDHGRISGWLYLPFGLASLLSLGVWVGSGTSFVFRTRRIDAMRARA